MKEKRKYSYTVMLGLSFLLAAGIRGYQYMEPQGELISEYEEELPSLPETEQGQESSLEVSPEEGAEVGKWTENPPEEEVPEEKQEPLVFQADRSYFDDALFIGDSRTVGLKEYGDLGNAEVLADSGMSVYKVFTKQFTLHSGEKMTLDELLASRPFGKIYIMLGINELGYKYDATVKRYEEMIDRIQELQPEAILFLEANLHISRKKSESSDIYNNSNIDHFNQAVKGMADGRQRFYLDVNELFDDEEGNLSDEYTVDEAHVLGKYYKDWVEWILERAVRI